jgi:hypothetical protein
MLKIPFSSKSILIILYVLVAQTCKPKLGEIDINNFENFVNKNYRGNLL